MAALPERDKYKILLIKDNLNDMKKNLAHSFEPLFATKPKGIGLGLAITKTHVERYGGSIEVQSELAEGSTFIVRLHVHTKEEEEDGQ